MNVCCEQEANREPGPGPRGFDGGVEPPPEVTLTHCTVCKCRHFEAVLDPGQFGVEGIAL